MRCQDLREVERRNTDLFRKDVLSVILLFWVFLVPLVSGAASGFRWGTTENTQIPYHYYYNHTMTTVFGNEVSVDGELHDTDVVVTITGLPVLEALNTSSDGLPMVSYNTTLPNGAEMSFPGPEDIHLGLLDGVNPIAVPIGDFDLLSELAEATYNDSWVIQIISDVDYWGFDLSFEDTSTSQSCNETVEITATWKWARFDGTLRYMTYLVTDQVTDGAQHFEYFEVSLQYSPNPFNLNPLTIGILASSIIAVVIVVAAVIKYRGMGIKG